MKSDNLQWSVFAMAETSLAKLCHDNFTLSSLLNSVLSYYYCVHLIFTIVTSHPILLPCGLPTHNDSYAEGNSFQTPHVILYIN